MWFNPGELSKTKTESQISKLAELAEPEKAENLIVKCYTPAGNPIEVQARNADHAAWLLRMNPEPKPKDTQP